MTADSISLLALSATIIVHLVTTVWWAASVTRRVEHIERWITHNERTAERLAALEQSMDYIRGGIERIEDFLRDND